MLAEFSHLQINPLFQSVFFFLLLLLLLHCYSMVFEPKFEHNCTYQNVYFKTMHIFIGQLIHLPYLCPHMLPLLCHILSSLNVRLLCQCFHCRLIFLFSSLKLYNPITQNEFVLTFTVSIIHVSLLRPHLYKIKITFQLQKSNNLQFLPYFQ